MSEFVGRYDFSSPPEVLKKRQVKYVKWFRDCQKVLDVGAGRGLFLELLRQSGIECEGVDIDEEAVNLAKAKGLACYREDASVFLQNREGRYDGLFCSNFLEHFPPDDVFEFLQLFSRAIRPGGLLILVGPNARCYPMLSETFWLDPTHVRFYPNLLLERVIERLGFTVIEAGDDPETRGVPPTIVQKMIFLILRWIMPRLFEGGEIYLVARRD